MLSTFNPENGNCIVRRAYVPTLVNSARVHSALGADNEQRVLWQRIVHATQHSVCAHDELFQLNPLSFVFTAATRAASLAILTPFLQL